MTAGSDTVLIVGAGLAGQRTAGALRASGHAGSITLVGAEELAAYERPALSKALLAAGHDGVPPPVPGGSDVDMARLGVRRLLGRRVERIDPAGAAMLDDGTCLTWHDLVFATGAQPRELPGLGLGGGVHALGSPAEAAALACGLGTGRRLVLVGCGFIGAEVAASARVRGTHVSIVEMGHAPFEAVLGREVGELLGGWYRSAGADLRCGTRCAGVRRSDDGRVAAVELDCGELLPADVVLVATGVVPRDELFHAAWPDAGPPGRGIPVDDDGTSFADVRVHACGDVASYGAHDDLHAPVRRIEHWTHAAQSAVRVARAITSRPAHPRPSGPHVRYAWSDQFGVRLQLVGETTAATRVEVECADPTRLLVRYLDERGDLVGGLASGRPGDVAQWRRSIGAHLAPGKAAPHARAS